MQTTTEEQIVRILGGKTEEKLLNSFFVLYKTARLVEKSNASFKKQSDVFFESLKTASHQLGDVEVKLVAGRYFINEMMVRFDEKGLSGAESVVNEWRKVGIGGVRFFQNISKTDVENFFIFMASVKPNSENVESIIQRLKNENLASVQLLSLAELQKDHSQLSEQVRKQFRQAARKTFFRAMSVAQDFMVSVANGQEVNATKTKRVVHSLIDHITRDESSLVELAAIKDYDDYTYAHSTNVCIYSLTLGVRIGMDRARLSQLGFAALFHDVGKVKLPQDLIRKPDAFDENDWIQMQQHPLLGAKTILRNMKLDLHTARCARGAFEHHINNDFTGYPQLKYKKRITNLYSKIIAIVDSFDALTSGRLYVKKPIPPDEVLKKMHYQMSVKFDPFLLKVFTNVVGIYPAGSLVLLNTEELGLILTNNEKDPAAPYIKIVGNKDGLLKDPIWVDCL
ncbi:MAG TPA: HD domain-containing phosphohydrolase, partial [candidate division Zixibacteria bacterium]|nr:HD domain-containing phosphohydrolase [candidate division Zixibacteria bacterium]